MNSIPLEHILFLSGLLFFTGLAGVLIRRNFLFILMSVEIMINAAGLAFVAAGAHWGQPDGQVMFIFILTMAASEVSVGLALILNFYHKQKTVDSDSAVLLKETSLTSIDNS